MHTLQTNFNIDMSLVNSYHPVTISVTFSKPLEIHMLKECGDHNVPWATFWFYWEFFHHQHDSKVALSHDITDDCTNIAPSILSWSVDAVGLFDGVYHSIPFSKVIDILPLPWWSISVSWHRDLTVQIKIG